MSSSNSRPDLPDGLSGLGLPIGDGQALAARTTQRAASVTLRQRGDAGDDSGSLDPATKSLGDALRITFRLLQAAMIVLLGLYLLSGFQSVKESERGMRLVLGRISAKDLPPGPQFSFPAPFGEMMKVQTGLQTEDIDKQFFPRLTEGEEKLLIDKEKGAAALAGGGDSLDPDADGHLITADGNIAHARWSLTWQRADAGRTATNIDPEFERKIVNAAASRGIVEAAASLSIDDLLKKQIDTSSSQAGTSKVETLARDGAQRALDEMESGIQISQLTLTLVIPPRNVMKAFQNVQSAQSDKNKSIDDARSERNSKLTEAAGEAAEDLLRLIDKYESDFATGDPAKAAAAMDLIDRVMLKESVAIDGVQIRPLSGNVSKIVDDARQFRTSVVNQAQSDVSLFESKRALFKSSPLVMINSEWASAFGAFLKNESLQTILLPPDSGRNVLRISRDQTVARDITAARMLKENEAAQLKRIQERERLRFQERVDPARKMTTE